MSLFGPKLFHRQRGAVVRPVSHIIRLAGRFFRTLSLTGGETKVSAEVPAGLLENSLIRKKLIR